MTEEKDKERDMKEKQEPRRKKKRTAPPKNTIRVHRGFIEWKPHSRIQCPQCKKDGHKSDFRDVVCYSSGKGIHYLRCNVCELRFKAVDPREKRLAEARERRERLETSRADLITAGIRLRMATKEYRAARRVRDAGITELKRARQTLKDLEKEGK